MQEKFYSSDSLTKRKLSVIGRERQMPTTDSQREFSKLQCGRRGGTFLRSWRWSFHLFSACNKGSKIADGHDHT